MLVIEGLFFTRQGPISTVYLQKKAFLVMVVIGKDLRLLLRLIINAVVILYCLFSVKLQEIDGDGE